MDMQRVTYSECVFVGLSIRDSMRVCRFAFCGLAR